MALPPGIGNPQQALQATAFMREQPWYKQFLASTGRNPNATDANGNPTTPLSDEEQNALLGLAQQHGIGISEDSYHVDENGQIAHNESHKLRNSLIAAGIAGSMFIPGVGPAVLGGLKAGGGAILHGLKGASTALTAGKGAASAVGSAISAGSKITDLLHGGLGIAEDVTNGLGNSAAQRAQAATNNRFLAARTDQAGPAADAQAFRNAMRSAIVSRMDPNAAPLAIGGHVLPSLATPETVDYAKTMHGNLATRQAAGKTPTEFGVPDAGAQETADTNAAGTYSKVSAGLNTGSKILNLLNMFRTNTDTSGDGGLPIPGGEFDPDTIYG